MNRYRSCGACLQWNITQSQKRNTFEYKVDEPRACYTEKTKYRTLTYIYAIWKHDTDELICRAGTESQTQTTDLWTQQGQDRVGCTERVALEYNYHI